jgi:hypothetical protein
MKDLEDRGFLDGTKKKILNIVMDNCSGCRGLSSMIMGGLVADPQSTALGGICQRGAWGLNPKCFQRFGFFVRH